MEHKDSYDHRAELLDSLPQDEFDNHIETLLEGPASLAYTPNEVAELGGSTDAPLSLDLKKNNCHLGDSQKKSDPEYSFCPKPVGHFRGVRHVEDGNYVGIRSNIACKRWQCPYCGPRKVKNLKRRIYKGNIAQLNQKKGFRPSRYGCKLLTLTVPGEAYRACKSPEDALQDASKAFHKLTRALKKKYGEYMYLRIVEPHKDGFPHFHILLVGDAIAPKEILESIRELWTFKYGMGNIDIQIIKKGFKAGVKYITKYITKDLKPICKGARIFSSSRNALEPLPKKPQWALSMFFFGVNWDFEDGNSEIKERQMCSRMPKNLTWEQIEEVFREEIEAFINEVFHPQSIRGLNI
jgi:hypothetical protein